MQFKYQYDAQDKLVMFGPSIPGSTQVFYINQRLVTQIQGTLQQSVMRYADQALAHQEQQSGPAKTTLLSNDRQGSVLNELEAARRRHFIYTAYGHLPLGNGFPSLLGFNGERPDPLTGRYILGNGYRAFSPVLKRFLSPDSLSPFGNGGLNAYAYCSDDPLNRKDPNGKASFFPKNYDPIKGIKNLLGRIPKKNRPPQTGSIAQIVSDDGYTHVGYHGTSRDGATNLMNSGVLEEHRFVNPEFENLLNGNGFYTADELSGAKRYAQSHYNEGRGGIVLSVSVKNFSEKRVGSNYVVGTYKAPNSKVKTFYPSTYSDIKVIRHGYYADDGKYTLYPNW